MKTRILLKTLVLLPIAMLLFSCSWTGPNDLTDNTQTSQAGLAVSFESSTLETAATALFGYLPQAPVSDSDTLTVGFRSSDVEFFSTEEANGDHGNFVSAKWDGENEARVSSVDCELPDVRNTFNFTTSEAHSIDALSEVAFGNYVYDIVRIDIGAGKFTVRHNGELVETESAGTNPEGEYSYGLSINSIFLVDVDLMGETPLYIEQHDFQSIDEAGYNEFITTFIKHNFTELNDQMNPEDYKVDMDGGLFIPFDGIDLREDYASVTVALSWDIANSFDDPDADGLYEAEDRVNGTPFDFEVTVTTET